ncbi:hypothetical protein [Burkholderia cenocepacia]|uniref:hypothetical protein n=1 Tax=Burkholderia cenocepacia TaxID=95486 RepID=UPI0026529911|nr:hypothetical protein [Burkholderia cenocepacia]MDN7544788.1 hypothetical protein [Burkholderia cenocepacia]MDN7626965.1 hypothetical protein [Burkholderia cenocepacia]
MDEPHPVPMRGRRLQRNALKVAFAKPSASALRNKAAQHQAPSFRTGVPISGRIRLTLSRSAEYMLDAMTTTGIGVRVPAFAVESAALAPTFSTSLTEETLMENEKIESLEKRIELCEASSRAQMEVIRALIATHPNPNVVLEAFIDFSEHATALALGTPTTDSSLAAYAMFRANWEEWLRWATKGAGATPPSDQA